MRIGRRWSWPKRDDNRPHYHFGQEWLEGEWVEDLDAPKGIVIDSPSGTIIIAGSGCHDLWICDGNKHWAGINNRTGEVLGFIMVTAAENPIFSQGTLAVQIKFVEARLPALPPPPVNTGWNGTCPSCGKGIYTGLFLTEHEGGGCKKA